MKLFATALAASLLAAGSAFAMCGEMARPELPTQTTAETAPIVLPQPPATGS